MADDNKNIEETVAQEDSTQLESGTYEIIKSRLNKSGDNLRQRLEQLNAERKKVFGSIEMQLISNQRIETHHECIARDIFALGNVCIFGYNIRMGLKNIELQDVFSIYEFKDDHSFKAIDLDFLTVGNEKFVSDFKSLYRYSKEVYFLKFAKDKNDPFFYMIFKDGNSEKTFKWEIRDKKLFYDSTPGDKKYKYPNQFEFKWESVRLEMYRQGEHPHISILDKVFVETVGGDLTIKIEDNTDTGKGIYAEDVKHANQKISDATVSYADLDNLIAIRIKPYQEDFRYFIYNVKLQTVQRVDALENSGVLLPGKQGLVFSNGFYLQTGDFKMFDKTSGTGNLFEHRIQSPNGEDHLYVFHNPNDGSYILLSYNVIEQTVNTPIVCHGYTLFPNGELCYFRSEEAKTSHHLIQIWQTPYIKGKIIPSDHMDSFLYKISNKDIVRAMAECQELLSLLGKDDTYNDLYYDLNKRANVLLDSYYWIASEEAFNLGAPLTDIRTSANTAIDEFEKVQSIKKSTREAIRETQKNAVALFKEINSTSYLKIDQFVQHLADLRGIRGEVISLRELRYTDIPLIEELESQAAEINSTLSNNCVEFLLKEDALQPYLDRVSEAQGEIEQVETARQGKQLEERIDAIGKELELLIEIVSNLKIEDATQTTRIIDNITAIFATLNQAKAGIKRRLRDLTGAEAVAEFAAQSKLLDQGLINYLDIADTVTKCDEYYTKMMIQIEELESKFAEFDEFIIKIADKREEINSAFESRRLSIIESINKRTSALQSAAERNLKGIQNRAKNFKEVSEINGFFASDLMIEKVRDTIQKLIDLDDTNKADDIQTKLKTIKEDAIRQLRDKKDLFSGDGNSIKFGKHFFSVNKQKLGLSMTLKDSQMYYHLTGTGFYEEVTDPDFLTTKTVWEQGIVSENNEVYRAEYLAYIAFKKLQTENLDLLSEEVLPYVQQLINQRATKEEGYSKGIHDLDAAKMLESLLYLSKHIDLLVFDADARAMANLYWSKFITEENKSTFDKQLKSAGIILEVFPRTHEFDFLLQNLEEELTGFAHETKLFEPYLAPMAARYLFKEISRHNHFIISGDAHDLQVAFQQFLEQKSAMKHFSTALQSLENNLIEQYQLTKKWLNAFVEQSDNANYANYVNETVTLTLTNNHLESHVVNVKTQQELTGLHGAHNVVGKGGVYLLDYNEFMQKLDHYTREIVTQYEKFVAMKRQLANQFKEDLRLGEFQPRVLSSFVRNKLIDQLYLPIFGDNLAKQIGTVGDTTRTDRMGMLLLISPPGYGKTTLMEYVADRLGLIFMKINGPAIGHHVISLDPSEATNAAASKELEKLNLALEMGDNIMIYLDDIQHCNPEFLQKFISLTDGQRKIEGIYKGVTKTYDLRGKRVCVVMAGNPYTESGDKFQVPDMLANRSDIYNLGDIIGDTKDIFELSYIENSLTSNSILQKMATKSSKDIYGVVKFAQTGSREGIDFEGNHTNQELNEYVEVIKRMLTVRDAILKVNLEYIRSAAMEDSHRTEPSFKLQGSYRNMNKLAEKITPITNDEELKTLIISHYEGESQTLTSGAESNMLKFKEMIGALTEEESNRWEEIKRAFNKDRMLQGSKDDPMVQVVAQLSQFSDHLKDIHHSIQEGVEKGVNMTNSKPAKKSGGISFRKS
ncbi:DNA repair ATPase [Aureispira anguillae]|uniref:DNA repair ATPase n=1 Tax=Aureispira anguillae TaxID=2864201 RepID=A0A916DQS5_9BACT|nr:DNA repair ATPase [Aureispira anguillae]BDS11349.1 DNA repair ATPase [Aureispira anguillae]